LSEIISINEALEYIHSVKWQSMKPGLERTRELLAALGNPEQSLKFIHIAGTNGKGSAAAFIASILRRAGYRTGLYISPYIIRFNERMQVNGEYITDDELVSMVDEIRSHADSMKDSPTEFELITALAMKYFRNKACDIVVLEVGMGGELDSTNVISTPEVAVITSIGFDHVKDLGPELTDIAKAKAGIIKQDGQVVIYGGDPEVEAVFAEVCTAQGASLHKVDFSRITGTVTSLDGLRFSLLPYGDITIPLTGAYQSKNAALAVTVIEVLRERNYKISDTDVVTGLLEVYWPGRFEVLGRSPVFILDGSHNPQGMEATADTLRKIFGERKITFILGVMADKDVYSMMGYIAPLAEAFIAVRPDYYRAMDAEELAVILAPYGVPVTVGGTIAKGVAIALDNAGADDVICAIGSLYFSGEIREAFTTRKE